MKRNKGIIVVNQIRYHTVDVEKSRGRKIKINHPVYIFLKINNEYIYVTMTHSIKVKDKEIVELSKNPNYEDKKKSFWVCEIKIDDKENFGRIHKGWKLCKEDIEKIICYFENWMKKR